MEPHSLQWVGSPCGLHGPYVFYKAFRFNLEGKSRILSLGDFFPVRCKPGEPACVAELQLLWEERTSGQLLSSSKLYFLPEDTPQGRTVCHGEDEVIAVSEKVIVRLEDLVKWTVLDGPGWTRGLRVMPLKPATLGQLAKNGQREALFKYRDSTHNSGLNFKDVLKEKAELGEDSEEKKVLVISYPQYCRYRSIIARLRDLSPSLLLDHVVLALGGIASLSSDTRILYCRDTFEHTTLIENESICDEFAPNLKGRPRKKKPSVFQRRDSQSAAKDGSGSCETKPPAKVRSETKGLLSKPKGSSSCKRVPTEGQSKVGVGDECPADEQAFLVALYKYMKERKTPIERIPYLGFKQINLWTMFQAAQKLGGYEQITARRQWKNVYDELGGNPGSTSAATCTRRHYERLILPFERYTKGEEDKPLPQNKPRKEAGAQEGHRVKVTTLKRPKEEQNHAARSETDASGRAPESLLASCSKEKNQNGMDIKVETYQPLQEKLNSEEEELDEELEFTVKKEALSSNIQDKPLSHRPYWERTPSDQVARDRPSLTPTKLAEVPLELANCWPEAADCGVLTHISKPPRLTHAPARDQTHNCIPEYTSPTAVAKSVLDRSVHKATPNHIGMVLPTLKQKPMQAFVEENEELLGSEESPFSYGAMVCPRSNLGIMSPLAKKKLLSQVSGIPGNYSYGPPPPLISKKCTEEQIPLAGLQVCGSKPIAMNRPSVIQHAHSFKSHLLEERKFSIERLPHDPYEKPQASPTAEPYLVRSDLQDDMEKTEETQSVRLTTVPTYFGDFYSLPHLHNLYKQSEHHLEPEEMVAKYVSREVAFPKECDGVLHYPSSSPPKVLGYSSHSSHKEQSSLERTHDDQPTDLSLPKSSPLTLACSKPSLVAIPHSLIGQDGMATSLFQVANTKASTVDYQPRACRVPPMTMNPSKKNIDLPSGVTKDKQGPGEDLANYKIEGMVRPVLCVKSTQQNVGAARPLKRNPEELENGFSEKKIRAVTPMYPSKDSESGKTSNTDEESEGMKTEEPVHSGRFPDGHKYPFHSPIFPGLYPGAFVSQVQEVCDSLGSHVPTSYSLPLQYLKNQAIVSPLVPPLALHSLMMQRHLLASAVSPPQIYRHPTGASYGDLLPHNLYPMSALNAQPAFSPAQLPSMHPSTKLS